MVIKDGKYILFVCSCCCVDDDEGDDEFELVRSEVVSMEENNDGFSNATVFE